ncbi:MAG: hypothetical protein GEU99_18030 [Luteitalea sp.]|nr:hypothetical protein [Luteitalea sp.]
MAEKTKWRIATHIRAATTPYGVDFVDVLSGAVLSTDVVGARIWSLAQQGCDLPSIAERLCAETNLPKHVAECCAVELMVGLAGRGLIEAVDPPGT